MRRARLLLATLLFLPTLVWASSEIFTLHTSTAETATGQGGAQEVRATFAAAYLNVTAFAGTNPTLNVKLQAQDGLGAWYDISGAAFTQVGGATSTQRIALASLPDKYIRAVWTITGSAGQSYTFTVVLAGKE